MGCSTCGKKYNRGANLPRKASRFKVNHAPKVADGTKVNTPAVETQKASQEQEAPQN